MSRILHFSVLYADSASKGSSMDSIKPCNGRPLLQLSMLHNSATRAGNKGYEDSLVLKTFSMYQNISEWMEQCCEEMLRRGKH